MINELRLLDMSDVGLGNLSEYRLLVLLGNYHSLCLVDGLKIKPDEIVDMNEKLLYPAYYMTHLKVPIINFIEDYHLWDRVDISVNASKFGSNILDSLYSFKRSGHIDKENNQAITMVSNSIFVVDVTIDKSINRTSSVPKKECIANLEKTKKVPDSLKVFKEVRNSGFKIPEGYILGKHVFDYTIIEKRDVSYNHGVVFAEFTQIMDICERDFLCGRGSLGLPESITSCIHTIDRETYYYSNCFADDVVECHMDAFLEKCEERNMTKKRNEVTPYWLNITFELYNKRTHNILVISKVKKIVCLPLECSDLESDINRIIKKNT